VILALLLPFFIIFPWIFSMLLPTAQSLLSQSDHSEFVQLPRVIQEYGYLPVALCLMGIFWLAMKGGQKNYGLVLGLLAMLVMLVCYYSLNIGVSIMYERGLTFMMLAMSIIAGAGLAAVRDFRLPDVVGNRLRSSFLTQHTGKFVYLALIIAVLFLAIPSRLNTSYYYMIDEKDYEAFVWIENNLGDEYSKAVLDPWKATAFSAITLKPAYSRIHSYPMEKDEEAYAFIRTGSTDTEFLSDNGLTIVYTRVYDGPSEGNVEYVPDNPGLEKVADSIYLFEE
jgi:hypothetical protein